MVQYWEGVQMGQRQSTLNDRYRLEKKIGAGGFAQVFLATDIMLGRQVAVKILEQSLVQDQEMQRRFHNEARAAASLDHSHILPIYDFGIDSGIPYLVMPYMSGGTLEARIKKERLTLDEVGSYLEQIGSALDYAHDLNIVHRDVKPSNLLFRPNGQLVLMDFGLAKVLKNISAGDANATLLGTIGYLAPEQIHGIVSAATDMYMLGIVLYQMLTGTIPFQGNTAQVLIAHVHTPPTPLQHHPSMHHYHPALVEALNTVIMKVLAKQPSERYQSGQALFNAYTTALHSDPQRAVRGSRDDKNVLRNMPDATFIEPSTSSPLTPPDNDQTAYTPPAAAAVKKVLVKPARLVISTEPESGYNATFELTENQITLGRAGDNTIAIPLSIISRHHATLQATTHEEQEVHHTITLLNTANKLYYQGKELHKKQLVDGDTLEIGQRNFLQYIVKLVYFAAEYNTR